MHKHGNDEEGCIPIEIVMFCDNEGLLLATYINIIVNMIPLWKCTVNFIQPYI